MLGLTASVAQAAKTKCGAPLPDAPCRIQEFDGGDPIRRAGRSYPLYCKGEGPALFLLHEQPGLTGSDVDLAARLVKEGYKVYVPLFFGSACDRHFYRFLFTQTLLPFEPFFLSYVTPHHTPAVANWLAAIIPEINKSCGGKGVGIIGNCLTGGLPLALLKVDDVKAAVLCQPTNPFFFSKSIDVSKKDLDAVCLRLKSDKMRVLGLKFSGDGKSKSTRFDALHKLLAGHFSELIIESGEQHSALCTTSHSVLAGDFMGPEHSATQEAYRRVVLYLNYRLKGTGPEYPVDPPDCDPKLFRSCGNF